MKFDAAWTQRIARLCTESERLLITPTISKSLHESKNRRHAAVLVPLCNRHGEASLLYTLRSQNVGTHKGHVSFPGGHQDPNEDSIQTAIREFYEEVFADKPFPPQPAGSESDTETERDRETQTVIESDSTQLATNPFRKYNTKELRILGVCQTVPAITGTLVTPVIALYLPDVDDLQEFSPSESEVDTIFTRRVSDLLSPEFVRYEMLQRNGESFSFPSYGDNCPPRIWGLTAIITQGILQNAILPTLDK